MAKKKRVQKNQFWSLYYHLKAIKHPMLREKPMPSHSELLAAGAKLFGIDTAGMSKRAAIDLITHQLPGAGTGAKTKRPKRRRKTFASAQTGEALSAGCVKFIVSDAFLESYEWKRLRYEVLKKHDGLCEVCGRGKPHGQVLNVDHIKPRRKHPELALDAKNLQVLCGDCNHGKGNWDSTDWRNRQPAALPEEREWERAAWDRFGD